MERRIGIVVHRSNPAALTFAGEVVAWLAERGVKAHLDGRAAALLGLPTLTSDSCGEMEFLLTLGGDGTILTAARMAAPAQTPILGVHLGRFGFIAETHPTDLLPQLETILEGQMQIEEREMVRAEVWRGEQRVHQGIGLNEAVIKSGMAHLLRLKTSLAGAPFATYPADGIIVATPTGSTAYALSAGGPLVTPTVRALLIVPICPHTLNARPLIVPSDEIIEIEVETDGDDVVCAVDGVDSFPLQDGDRLVACRADYRTRLIVLEKATFYRKVRNRYLYGERLNG